MAERKATNERLAGLPESTEGGVTLQLLPHLAQVGVRVQPALGMRRSFPFELPVVPNTWTATDSREVLWLGPDEWLVVGTPDPAETPLIVAELEDALHDVHHSVVDVTANRQVLALNGSKAIELLSTGCGLDFHPSQWQEGRCAQTLLAKAQVILQHHGDLGTQIFVRPSFADYLIDWLIDASGSIASGERPAR
jgi:sarcosine oxidase subunit gamma